MVSIGRVTLPRSFSDDFLMQQREFVFFLCGIENEVPDSVLVELDGSMNRKRNCIDYLINLRPGCVGHPSRFPQPAARPPTPSYSASFPVPAA